MSLFLLDTCIFENYLKNGSRQRCPELVSRVDALLASNRAAISYVSLYEKRVGLHDLEERGQGHKAVIRFEMFLRSVLVLGLDAHAGVGWDLAARLRAGAKAHKPALTLGAADVLIGATALAHDRILVTADNGFAEWMALLGHGSSVQRWTLC